MQGPDTFPSKGGPSTLSENSDDTQNIWGRQGTGVVNFTGMGHHVTIIY